MFRQGQLAVHGLAILLGRNEAGISNRGKNFLHHAVLSDHLVRRIWFLCQPTQSSFVGRLPRIPEPDWAQRRMTKCSAIGTFASLAGSTFARTTRTQWTLLTELVSKMALCRKFAINLGLQVQYACSSWSAFKEGSLSENFKYAAYLGDRRMSLGGVSGCGWPR